AEHHAKITRRQVLAPAAAFAFYFIFYFDDINFNFEVAFLKEPYPARLWRIFCYVLCLTISNKDAEHHAKITRRQVLAPAAAFAFYFIFYFDDINF
ncbi:hypothetical protein CK204_27235, partial [Klebsiella pneumoniae]